MSRSERAARVSNHGVAFEPRDANARALLYVGVGILVAAVLIHLGVYLLYGFFAAREGRRGLQPSTMVPAGRVNAPPEPRLQVEPPHDLEELRRAQGEKLRGYDWADRGAGTVRIPIERAMDLLVQRGLPQAQPAQPANGTDATNAPGRGDNTNAPRAEEHGGAAGTASGSNAGKRKQ